MASIRPMTVMDLLKFSSTNLDHLTETYNIGFYLEYLSKWPDLCRVIEGHDGKIEGYLLAKVEASPYPPPVHPYDPETNPDPNYLPWHGHITALTVAPSARRLGHATRLTESLEQQADSNKAWFVDLYVRAENKIAQELYKKMGRVVGYYNDNADAFDMRKPLSRDKDRKHVRENGENIKVDPHDVW
ncbi:acyl-CoA N-acyltransferase [Lepidopterella palustris CBS 459.81]|uniref:Acyl-CoA N-acyltransferase n=1 Tax=Lepidopterella palustris CBS 459.81 TaxID=1314670 RepID=A0A8E2JGD0_9PEZI|nr:acyl-CoA N-acyltransferase [Lepidopterella palustris CBS 459.81]